MSSGRLTKVDILAKVYKMKTELHVNSNQRSKEWSNGANAALNKILDYLNEFSS